MDFGCSQQIYAPPYSFQSRSCTFVAHTGIFSKTHSDNFSPTAMSHSKAFPTLPVSLKVFLNNARKWKDALVQKLLQGWQLPGHTMTSFTIDKSFTNGFICSDVL
jgi:hypothetical protein